MKQAVAEALRRFGQDVLVVLPSEAEAPISARAFIAMEKKAQVGAVSQIRAGVVQAQEYLYIGPANVRLDLFSFGTRVRCEDDTFVVKSAEKISFGGEILFVQGILQKGVPLERCGPENVQVPKAKA